MYTRQAERAPCVAWALGPQGGRALVAAGQGSLLGRFHALMMVAML